MSLPPQKFREIAFQILYAWDFSEIEPKDAAEVLMDELKVTKKSVIEAYERVTHIRECLKEIDAKIDSFAVGYEFDRISRVEKNILRLGVYELLYDPKIPPKVAIAEAIRLCRKFGTPESAHFVNAVLDRMLPKSVEPLDLPVNQDL